MPYKIIASDLDGTLFNKQGQLSKENLQAIEEMQQMGVHFVPASGRSFEEMPENVRSCPYIRYYITSDGGTVYDKQTGHTFELAMSRQVSNRVLDVLYRYPVNMMLHADTGSYVDIDYHTEADYFRCNYSVNWKNFVFETNRPIPNFKQFAYSHEAVQQICVFFQNYEDLLTCKDIFEKDRELLVAQSNKNNLEIVSAKAGKGNALLYLADILGIDRRQTIAVGDSTNDFTMVQAAGLGLAMDNAVPELKHIADKIICNNEEHSARYILNHFIKEKSL